MPLLEPRSRNFPRMTAIRQALYSAPLTDDEVVARIRGEFAALALQQRIKQGTSVAIAVGSRGIDRIALTIRTLVEQVKALGGEPFVFPAMGSHGGATAPGQKRVLETLGVTEAFVGCPVQATMEVVTIGCTPHGLPVYLDRFASQADAIVVVNRVKPHTNFRGPLESGLMKLLAIGAGKHVQASTIHRLGVPGLRDHMPEVARVVLEKAPIVAGFALLEDGCHALTRIAGIRPADLEATEIRLLDEARAWQPHLPVGRLDLLLVDRIGKELSGTGMDPNVIGRCRLLDFNAFPEPLIKVITVHDLSDDTRGNAIGIGMADLTTRRAADKFNAKSTYTNTIIGLSPAMGALPITLDSDREVVRTALDYLCGVEPPEEARVIRISDTLHLDSMEVSESVAAELRGREDITFCGPPREMAFDEAGALAPLRT